MFEFEDDGLTEAELEGAAVVFAEQCVAEGIDLSQFSEEQQMEGFSNWLAELGAEPEKQASQMTDKQAEAYSLGEYMAMGYTDAMQKLAAQVDHEEKVASVADNLRAALGMEKAAAKFRIGRTASELKKGPDGVTPGKNVPMVPQKDLKSRLGRLFSKDQAKVDLAVAKQTGREAWSGLKGAVKSPSLQRMAGRAGLAAGGLAAAGGAAYAGKKLYDRSKSASALDAAAEEMILAELAESNPEAYNQLVAERAQEMLAELG